MSLSLSQKIQAIYPQLKTPEDWDGIVLLNTLETDGDYIDQWNHSSFPKPTQEPLDSVNETEYLNSFKQKESEALRSAAYKTESDPLFFKYQAGEVTKEEWLAKREEIKVRYPDPS